MQSQDNNVITQHVADEADTLLFAQRFARCLRHGVVIYLEGDLGAGKTTLVRGTLNALGHTGRVKSPTYTLMESYTCQSLEIRHFDLYRLVDENEWEAAGFRDEFNGENIFFIEWPEKAAHLIPPADLTLRFEILPQGRNLTIQSHSTIGNECLTQL